MAYIQRSPLFSLFDVFARTDKMTFFFFSLLRQDNLSLSERWTQTRHNQSQMRGHLTPKIWKVWFTSVTNLNIMPAALLTMERSQFLLYLLLFLWPQGVCLCIQLPVFIVFDQQKQGLSATKNAVDFAGGALRALVLLPEHSPLSCKYLIFLSSTFSLIEFRLFLFEQI